MVYLPRSCSWALCTGVSSPVPLNVRGGVAQLSYTLDHCDANVVFVETKYDALIKELTANVQRPIKVVAADLDACPDVQESPPVTSEALPPVEADDAALLMYSSGSTGQPKGALHTNRSVLAHGRNSALSHQLTSADRSLLVLPMYHINAECVTLLPTLLSGQLCGGAAPLRHQPLLGLAG